MPAPLNTWKFARETCLTCFFKQNCAVCDIIGYKGTYRFWKYITKYNKHPMCTTVKHFKSSSSDSTVHTDVIIDTHTLFDLLTQHNFPHLRSPKHIYIWSSVIDMTKYFVWPVPLGKGFFFFFEFHLYDKLHFVM